MFHDFHCGLVLCIQMKMMSVMLNVHEDIDFSLRKTIKQNSTYRAKTLRREVSKAIIGTYRFTT